MTKASHDPTHFVTIIAVTQVAMQHPHRQSGTCRPRCCARPTSKKSRRDRSRVEGRRRQVGWLPGSAAKVRQGLSGRVGSTTAVSKYADTQQGQRNIVRKAGPVCDFCVARGCRNPTWRLPGRPQTSHRFASGLREFGRADRYADV